MKLNRMKYAYTTLLISTIGLVCACPHTPELNLAGKKHNIAAYPPLIS